MTEEEIEVQAEDYAIDNYEECIYKDNIGWRNDYKARKQSFRDGAKWGTEHAIEWHDLRKNPDDLPKEKGTYWVYCYSLGYEKLCYMAVPYDVGWGTLDKVIAWCELPKFKE